MALKHQALPDQATQENFLDVDNRLGFFEGKIYRGFGTPEATVKANPGAIYLNDSGGPSTTLYMKESGTSNTGWSAVGAASAAGLHNLLSATHPDTLADSVAAGDLIIGNATPKWARLAAGSNGQVLTLSGGLPTWAAASGGATALLDGSTHTDTTNSAVTRGDLIVGNSTPAWDDLAIGSASTVLISNGTDPSWGTVTSAMITDGTIVDADVNASGITTRTKLPSAIAYEDEANAFVTPATGQQTITGSGAWPASASTGGLLNVTTTGGTGAGVVVYSNRGADAAGRLLVLNNDNAANTQQVLRVVNDGTGQTISVQSTNASADETLSITSATTSGFSTFGVTGAVTDKGTAKITHDHPGLIGDDANAAVLRLNWSDSGGTGTAIQGIFMATEALGPVTTGDLIKVWNGPSTGGTATTKLWLDPNGQLALNQTGTTGGLLLGADVLLYRSAADKLSLGAGDSFDSPTIITPTIASFANATHNHSNAAGGGNLTGTAFATQTANTIFAGPTTGAAATATFRALVNADVKELLAIADLTDVTASSGTGTTVLFQGSPSITTPTIASFANSTHNHSNAAGGGNITGSAFATQSANTVFAGPTTGAAATAAFRALVTADVAELLAATDLSDVAAKSGTGTTILFQGSPTITTPTIASFANANHDHTNSAGGGTLTSAALTDFTTAARAAISVTDTASIDLTYAGGAISGAVLPAGVDHNTLANLTTGDVHTQYALLAGRNTGQTLMGDTAASGNLKLQSTASATRGVVNVPDTLTLISDGLTLPNAVYPAANVSSAVSMGAGSSTRLSGYAFGPTVTVTGTVGTNSLVLFGASGSISPDATGRNLQSFLPFNSTFAVNGFAAGTVTAGSNVSYTHNPRYLAIASAGTGTATAATALSSSGTVADGWTVSTWRGVFMQNPTVSGTGVITDLLGVDIANLTAGSTSNISIRSQGVNAEMRHAGPAKIGANTAVVATDYTAPALELERNSAGATAGDGYVAGLALDPGYLTSGTISRHNYIDVQDIALGGTAAVTDAAIFRFDNVIGSHKALASPGAVAVTLGTGPTGSTAGNPQGWMKINVNGTLRYVPFW